MRGMDEVILPRVGFMFRFDGQVAEVFSDRSAEAHRAHVALMKEPEIGRPDRRGRSSILALGWAFSVNADELSQLRPLLDKIAAAARAAKAERPQSP
jgi:hypothetical protein